MKFSETSLHSLTIVIPTHNRPTLLLSAIESALDSYDNICEVIVIDDASDPPVDSSALAEKFGSVVQVHRNSRSQGIAKVRVSACELAKGEYIFQLDDDDLLAPGALSTAMHRLISTGQDILYIGVEGFGERGKFFNKSQFNAVLKLLDRSGAKEVDENLYNFEDLVIGLLDGVPSAFQHPLTKTEVWRKVNELRFDAFSIKENLQPQHKFSVPPVEALIDSLNESEWTIYAAMKWKIIFLNQPLYLARCEGIRNYSVPQLYDKHMEANRVMKKRLYCSSLTLKALEPWRSNLLASYSRSLFDAAYSSFFKDKDRIKSWGFLIECAKTSIKPYMIKFFVRTLLPIKWHKS